jgi:hypothetical protein
MTQIKDPYRVIEEKPGCSHCNCGALYMIVFDDEDGEECGTSTSYGGPGTPNDEAREAAQEVADDLSAAYVLGRTRIAADINEFKPSADSVAQAFFGENDD